MSAYDAYDAPRERTYRDRYYREERRDTREPRYVDNQQETYLRVNPSSRTELIPRPREDSDLSVEEIRRDFPPPGYSRDVRRARSAEPGYYDEHYDQRRDYYDSRSSRDYRPSKKAGSVYYEEEERTRKRVLNQQEKIMAAVVGGVIAAGAKEAWDRYEAKQDGREPERNMVASAALGAAGALAGYQGADYYNKHAHKDDKKATYIAHKGRDGRITEYYNDDDDEEDPKSHKGNKSFLENALAAAGLGGAIKALTGGGDDRDRDDRRSEVRSRRGSVDSRRSEGTPAHRMQKAAKASLVAGAAEAFRVAREPGGWKGEKMKRVLTAAAGAATIDAAHDPSKDSKRHLMESVIGGLVGNRVLNGSRKDIEEDRRTGRSRSRSRARSEGGGGSGLAALATAGLGAIAGKKLLDKRDESRGRRGSPDSYDSRDGSPRRRQRSRSRSIVDGARRSLAKIGIGSGPSEDRERDRDDYYDDSRSSRRSRHGRSPSYDDDYTSRGYMRGGRGGGDEYYEEDRSSRRERRRSRSRGGRSSSVSSSDLGDSDEDAKKVKKLRGKQLVTTGLATVASIHAAHSVYQSMQARNARHKAVKEGRLTPLEARKLKSKALLQDAASVGIAALGVKGAISELKEARDKTNELSEWQEEKKRRHERRMERLKKINNGHYGRSRADNWSSSAAPRTGAVATTTTTMTKGTLRGGWLGPYY